MGLIKRVSLPVALIAGTLLFTACPNNTNIRNINSDPNRYSGREVRITGRVTDSFGIPGSGVYEVDDGTGRIWVVSNRGVPSRNARVSTRGNVRTGITVGGRTFGTVIQETDRRTEGK